MPKIVDHDQRRSEIVRVIIRVISEEGLSGTTVRSISRAGGFSSGVLSHYFSDKDEMIKFAFAAVSDMIFERIDERLETASGVERLRAIIEEHVPLTEHDDETAVALAFWEVALHDTELRNQYRANYGRWRSYLAREMLKAFPELSEAERSLRASLAIATTDGLLVTFALEGEDYGSEMRRTLVNRIMDTLTIGPALPEDLVAKQMAGAGVQKAGSRPSAR